MQLDTLLSCLAATMSDYVMTIDSDSEDVPIPSTSKSSKTAGPADDTKLDPEFVFDIGGDPYIDLTSRGAGLDDLVKTGSKPVRDTIMRSMTIGR